LLDRSGEADGRHGRKGLCSSGQHLDSDWGRQESATEIRNGGEYEAEE
jgi:hypothetical protein